MTAITAIRSQRVVLPGGVRSATLRLEDGRIAWIDSQGTDSESSDLGEFPLDAGDLVVMPGVIDAHVHLNEPGRTDWEGFASGTRSAAAGGVTTLVDMPLNAIPATIDRAAFALKRDAAAEQCFVDVGFWGGCVPGNSEALQGLWEDGVLGFKAFLSPSGVPEFRSVTHGDLDAAAPILSSLGATLLVHAEDATVLAANSWADDADPTRYSNYLATRPTEAEERAVHYLIDLSRRHTLRIHVVHLATESLLAPLAAARAEGVAITVETCPHYLTFDAESIPDGATPFKCAPPIRSARHREGLWGGLADGILDLIASDHSPSPPEAKQLEAGNFRTAWGGIASLQLLLPAVWTEAKARGHDFVDLHRWLSRQPARLANLQHRKGRIAPGFDADLVLWNPEDRFTVEGKRLYHRHSTMPWEGRCLDGVVEKTILRGQIVFDRSLGISARPMGELLHRQRIRE